MTLSRRGRFADSPLVILGTLLLVVVIGAGIAGAWKYRTLALGDDEPQDGPLTDEMLVALARKHDEARG